MESLVMFISSLLVLMASTQVTYASSEKLAEVQKLLCEFKPATIVAVSKEKHSDKDGNTVNDVNLAASSTYSLYLVELTNDNGTVRWDEFVWHDVQVPWQTGKCVYRFTKGSLYYISDGADMKNTKEAINCMQETGTIPWSLIISLMSNLDGADKQSTMQAMKCMSGICFPWIQIHADITYVRVLGFGNPKLTC